MPKILMIIAPEGFQDQEYGDPKGLFEAEGYEVVTASTVHEATGKFGSTAKVDVLIQDINPGDYDAVAFIGGPGCDIYFEDQVAHKVAQAFYSANKLTCAICAAPGILANAGLLEGKTMTCWQGEAAHVQEKGAHYTGNPVEQDGLIITATGPDTAKLFGEKIIEALRGSRP